MKIRFRYILQYVPPVLLLSFLLVTNLFTRAAAFRNFIFPENTIHISASYSDDFSESEETIPVSDLSQDSEDEIILCQEENYRKGNEYYKKRQFSSAIELWNALLQTETACSKAAILNNMGVAYVQLSRFKTAEELFKAAISDSAYYARAWYNLGICYSKTNSSTQALESYTQSIILDSSLNRAHFNIGVMYLKKKQFSTARKHLRNALTWGMNKSICWYNIALSFQYEDSSSHAINGYLESIRFEPGLVPARLRMAEIYTKKGLVDSAASLIESALKIQPNSPEIYVRLARSAIDRKEYDKAMDCLNKAEAIQHDYVEITYQRARIYGRQGENKRALKLYRELIDREPSNPRIYYNMGVNLMDLEREDEAVEAYTRSLRVDPSYWKTAYNLGIYYLKKNQPREAKTYFSQVVTLTPEKPQAHYNLGLAYLREGNLKGAKTSFQHSVQLDSTYIEGRYNLGLTFMKSNEYDSAEQVFNTVLAIDSCHTKTLYNTGIIYRRKDRFDEADRYFYRAITCRKEDYPSAWYNRALCKRDLDEIDSALFCVERALVRPDTETIPAKILLLQAKLYEKQGSSQMVINTLERADSLAGYNPDALMELGQFYTRRKDLVRARKIYKKIIAVDSSNSAIFLAAANIEKSMGNPDTSDFFYKKAIESDSSNIEALESYSRFLMIEKRFDDALRILQKAILINPRSVETRIEIALIYAQEKKMEKYKREVGKLRKLPLKSSDSYDVGRKLLRANLFENAEWFFRNAVEKNPGKADYAFYHNLCLEKTDTTSLDPIENWSRFTNRWPDDYRGYYSLAKEYIKADSLETARTYLERARDLKETDLVLYNLARVCYNLGDYTCSEKHITLYLKNNPRDSKGKRLYEMLKRKKNT